MSWSKSRDITTEQSISNTNVVMNPWGLGCPASTKEYNIKDWLRIKADQEIYRSMSPSGFITKIKSVSLIETTTTADADGELMVLTTNGIPLSNQIRLGNMLGLVNGWKIPITNTAGTTGTCSNITLPAPPTTGNRIDLAYLEVWIAELGGTSATISNTSNKPDATHLWLYGNTQYAGTNATDDISEVDMEINRRWQIQYAIQIAQGVNIDTYPDGVSQTSVVKAFGASGAATPYTFSVSATDPGLYVAGDGSTTAKATLGTIDGYSYAIPIAAIYRRNTGIYADSNRDGCAASGPSGGTIASGISGRPDHLYADQIVVGDLLSLRHQALIQQQWDFPSLLQDNFDKLLRGNSNSLFGVGDGTGNDAAYRSTAPLIAQELNSSSVPYYLGFSQYNYQRRIYSDAAVLQQTEWNYTAATVIPTASLLPWNVNPPAVPALAASAGGTLNGITIYVRLTYCTDATGLYETNGANEASLAMGTNGTLTISSPAAVTGASYYNVYAGTTTGAANLFKQNSSPISIGTNKVLNSALLTVTATQTVNSASSPLLFTLSTSGLKNPTGAAIKTMTNSTNQSDAGGFPNGYSIIVYEFSTGIAVTGVWSGLGTVSSTFRITPGTQWSAAALANGVVSVFGIYYPAGNGLNHRPYNIVAQDANISGTDYTVGVIGTGNVGTGNNNFALANGVATDTAGNIFVVDTGNHRILKYSSAFVFQAQFGQTGVSGNDTSHLNSPQGIAIDSSNNVYISDTMNHRLVKLSNSLAIVGTPLFNTGVAGSDSSHLNTPLGMNINSTNLFIADSLNNRVVEVNLSSFTYSATPVTGLANAINCVTVDASGNYWITTGHSVARYTSGGSFSARFGSVLTSGASNYALNSPSNIEYGADGYIYVADTNNHRIVRLNNNLIYVGQYGVTGIVGTDTSHLNHPTGFFLDTIGGIYISDTNNYRVVKTNKFMGACDFPLRQFEIVVGGNPTDTLKLWYNFKAYQGIIASQGSTPIAYHLKALTPITLYINTLGTGGRNTVVSDLLNGALVNLPMPSNDGTNTIGEWACSGTNFTISGYDNSPLLTTSTAGLVGSEGNSSTINISGSQILISQLTAAAYSIRGINTLQRYVDNYGYDSVIANSIQTQAVNKCVVGAFLAVASGDLQNNGITPVIPDLIKGEIVMVVINTYNTSTSSQLNGQTNVTTAIDIFRLQNRPIVRY
jgi:sugar lactone lactonase YvrE